MAACSRITRVARRTLGTAAALLAVSARLSAQAPSKIDSVTVASGVRVPVALTGASRAVVDSNDVKTAAALTFSELMQARGTSVNVMMSGGRLVDGGHFLVRGPSTILTEGAPMLVVDGMRMAEQEDDFGSTTSRLDDIAIDDIAKVVLSGRDLATWSSWPGLDPEISSSFRGSITRNDQGAVPLPRRIMVGVELDY